MWRTSPHKSVVLFLCVYERLKNDLWLLGHNHPTITSHQQAREVLRRFRSQYHPPSRREGYDRELWLAAADQELPYSAESLRRIVHSLMNSPKITQDVMMLPRPGYDSLHCGDHSNYRGYHHGPGASHRTPSRSQRSESYRGQPTNFRGASNDRGRIWMRGYRRSSGFIASQGLSSLCYWEYQSYNSGHHSDFMIQPKITQ
jgi:hypothetical protein